MKRVEWWVSKVYPSTELEGRTIDLWDQFDSRRDAEAHLKKVDKLPGENPFSLTKVTIETIPRRVRK